ncbi:MarR family winged helix-turn-helix transcriptional regulator [Williamsia sp. M5A3_1d]
MTEPLDDVEGRVWRALARALVVVPRDLETDLQRESGLTLGEYQVLVILSESPGRRCRMTELASLVGLSASRMTRLIAALTARGDTTRMRDGCDRRGMSAVLTDAGFERLEAAYPAHLASVRTRVLDPLRAVDAEALAAALELLAGPIPQLKG